MSKEALAQSAIGRRALRAEISTADGTLQVRSDTDGGIIVGIVCGHNHRPIELPALRPLSASALRTLLDDALEAQAAEDA